MESARKRIGLADLFGAADAAHDVLAAEAADQLVDGVALDVAAGEAGVKHGGVDGAGENGVGADLVGAEFQRHGAGQREQGAFAGGVGGDADRGGDRVNGTDVDDRAAAGFSRG